jgi:pilus assembly protein Flp/PilA
MTFVKTFLRDDSGASAAEYALILAIVGAAIVFGSINLGAAIGTELNATADCIGSADPETDCV